MKCPNCQNEMIGGIAQVRSRPMDMLAAGIGAQQLFFDFDDDKYMKVLLTGAKSKAFLCEQCSGMFIDKSDQEFLVDPLTGVVTEINEE